MQHSEPSRTSRSAAAQRHAVAEYWRLWLAGQVSNAVVILQHRDGTWRTLTDTHVPDPQPRRRKPVGEGRYRGPEAPLRTGG